MRSNSPEKHLISARSILGTASVAALAFATAIAPQAIEVFNKLTGKGVEHGVLSFTDSEEEASLRPSRYGFVNYDRKWDWSSTDQAQGDRGKSEWISSPEAYQASLVK